MKCEIVEIIRNFRNEREWQQFLDSKNLKAEIDEDKIEAFRGTVSLEFEPGSSVAVKIIDDRGIESLRVLKM